jgi:hypothetical protein
MGPDPDPCQVYPDIFKQIRILERTTAEQLSVSQLELLQNPPDLRTLILHIWTL